MSVMGAVWLRLRAELRQQWRAVLALAVLLGLIAGIALIAAAGARRTVTAYPRFLHRSHAADLLVTPARSGFHGYFRAIARLPEVASADAAAFLQMSLPIRGASPFSGMVAEASPFGGEGVAINRVKVDAGRIFDAADPRAVMINQRLADRAHVRPGGTLHLIGYPQRNGNPDVAHPARLAFRVSAIVTFADEIVPASGELGEPRVLLSPAFARTPQAQSFNPAGGGAYVVLRPGADAVAFTHKAAALARRYQVGSVQVVHLATAYAATQRAVRPEAAALAIFAALASLIALAIIGQLLSRQLVLDSAEFPVLRALGMGRSGLAALSLARVAIVTTAGAGGGHDRHPGQRQRGKTGPAHAERAQDRELGRVEDELAAQQLPDDGECDQACERGEDRKRGRFRPDRPLGRRVRGGQMDDLDAAHLVAPGQSRGLVGERDSVGPGPQHHIGAAPGGIERLCLRRPGERRAQQHPRLPEFPGGRNYLVGEGHDRRDPERQPRRVRNVGVAVALRVPDEVQRAAGTHVSPVRQPLVDHDRAGVGRVEDAASVDLDPVDRHAFTAERARLGHHAGEGRRAPDRQGHLQERCRVRRRHLWEAGDGAEVAVEPGPRRGHQQVRGVAPVQEARVGGDGAPRTGGSDQRDAGDQPEQDGQGQYGPPLLPQFGAQAQPDGSHNRHSGLTAGPWSRMQASPPWWCCRSRRRP